MDAVIRRRNNDIEKEMTINTNNRFTSIFNKKYHSFQKAKLFTLGQFLAEIKVMEKHHNLIFNLDGV